MKQQELMETILSKETIYNGHIISLEKWQVRLPNGQQAVREIIHHNGASAIVALDEHKRIAMVEQYRCPISRITMELPAGKLDSPFEDPLECAKRELEEETGLHASTWQKLTVMDTTPGFCNEHIHIYLATDLEQKQSHTDEDEFLNVSFIPFDVLLKQVTDGEITDGKTVIGLLLANKIMSQQ